MRLQVVLVVLVTIESIELVINYDEENPVIMTASGYVKGSILNSRLGRKIYSFRGMRYAKPPVGELRFKSPVPIGAWDNIYDATNDGPLCSQPADLGNSSEDCLNINIYSTKLPENRINPKRPVIIYFSAGGFYSIGGASYWIGPQYIMDVDVVFVTFNARLASLGFISTGDEFAPGNNGLKDQVEMLRWVKKHIAAFGGDPDNITLYGYSAGAWSVVLQMVSAMTQGQNLFHKAIIGSNPINLERLPKHQFHLAQKQARFVGCPDDTSENIINCLKNVSAEIIAETLPQFNEFGSDPVMIWYPVIDGEFLTDDPVRLLIEKKFNPIPVMIGQTKDEFGLNAFTVMENDTLLNEMNENFTEVAPIAFMYERSTKRSANISRDIKEFYFNGSYIDRSQLNNLANAYNDAVTGFGVNRYAKLLANYSSQPVYRYCFTFQGRYSHFVLPGTNQTWGVVHHDDLIYIFYISRIFPLFGKDDPQPEVNATERVINNFYSFAKTGNPSFDNNIKWEPFTIEKQQYLDFGVESVMKERLYEDRYDFWEKHFPLDLYESK